MKKAVVIGAGYGGIAASLRLRAKGYDVEVIDQCSAIGGRAQVYEVDGFKHDAGPTVLTAPFLFEELFNLFDKNISDYVNIVPLETWYQFYFPDGKIFNYGGSLESTLKEIEKFEPEDKQNYLHLLEKSKAIFKIGFEDLADEPFHKFSKMLGVLPDLIRLNSFKTVWGLVSSHLKSPYMQQAFSIQSLLVGGNPFDTTSIYSLIHYLEREWGVHFAMGGTGSLTKAFETLMYEEGIKVSLNEAVQKVDIKNGKAVGVILKSGEIKPADIVVSNADAAYLYSSMIDKKDKSISVQIKTKYAQFSMGLYVLYFGTTKQYTDIEHHTIWLGKRYEELLDDIFHKQILADDFSLYLHRPTATDPSFAPEGCDSFYVLAPVPNQQGEIDWKVEGPKLRDKIVKALNDTILPDLENTITADFFKTPDDFEQDYSSVHGAGFSISPLLTQSAWFRYHNKAEGIENLYLVGAGTHPGAGLPGVVCSAKVIDNLIPISS
jgi:phytoene desaturase